MLSDLIFGPAVTPNPSALSYGEIALRGRRIDVEAVHEAIQAAAGKVIQGGADADDASIEITVFGTGGYRTIGPEDVAGLGLADRQRMRITVVPVRHSQPPHTGNTRVTIEFGRRRRTTVAASYEPPGQGRQPNVQVRDMVAAALVRDGSNLIPWRQLSRHLVLLPIVLMLASWIVLLAGGTVPAAGAVLGWVLLATLAAAAVAVDVYLARRYAEARRAHPPGVARSDRLRPRQSQARRPRGPHLGRRDRGVERDRRRPVKRSRLRLLTALLAPQALSVTL
jgi:hypothetical protein